MTTIIRIDLNSNASELHILCILTKKPFQLYNIFRFDFAFGFLCNHDLPKIFHHFVAKLNDQIFYSAAVFCCIQKCSETESCTSMIWILVKIRCVGSLRRFHAFQSSSDCSSKHNISKISMYWNICITVNQNIWLKLCLRISPTVASNYGDSVLYIIWSMFL